MAKGPGTKRRTAKRPAGRADGRHMSAPAKSMRASSTPPAVVFLERGLAGASIDEIAGRPRRKTDHLRTLSRQGGAVRGRHDETSRPPIDGSKATCPPDQRSTNENADAKFDAFVERNPRVAFDHGVLHFDGAAHRVDDAAELDDAAVAGAFDDPAVMNGDCGINQIAAQRAQSRQGSIFVRASQPAITDHIRDQESPQFSGFRSWRTLRASCGLAQKPLKRWSCVERAKGYRPRANTRRAGFESVRCARQTVAQ